MPTTKVYKHQAERAKQPGLMRPLFVPPCVPLSKM